MINYQNSVLILSFISSSLLLSLKVGGKSQLVVSTMKETEPGRSRECFIIGSLRRSVVSVGEVSWKN